MEKIRKLIIAFLLSTSLPLQAQDVDSLLTNTTDFFLEGDSLSIFALVDSLLALEDLEPVSQLAVRLSYNSNVIAAGRTLGIENFGLSPAISYYHTSGAYADLSGFWSKDFDPTYYLTIATIGYSHTFNKNLSVIASYDRYFYNVKEEDAYVPYKNSLSVTPTFYLKQVYLSAGYSYFFGDKKVHRLFPSLGITLQKKNFWRLDRIALLPSFSILLGNETFTEIVYVETIRELIKRLRMNQPIFDEKNTAVFGVLNYSFNLPISITHKKLNFIFSYSYSIPKSLPGETLTLSESSFLSASLIYSFDLKRNKKLWE